MAQHPAHQLPAAGGKCASCGVKSPCATPQLNLVTGLLTPASPALLSPRPCWAIIFTWALVALTMIDIDHTLLPDDITLPLLWLGLLFNLGGTYVPSPSATVIGAMAGYLILWGVLAVQAGHGQGRHGLR